MKSFLTAKFKERGNTAQLKKDTAIETILGIINENGLVGLIDATVSSICEILSLKAPYPLLVLEMFLFWKNLSFTDFYDTSLIN